MEPTTKPKGSKWVMAIVAIIVILLIVMVMSNKKTEAPVEEPTISGANIDNSTLEAEIEASMNFETETSMSEMDTVFQQ